MTDPVDKSLLDRLQALRGHASSAAVRAPPTKISIDPIERRRTPTREEALAARLKSLRDQDASAPSTKTPQPKPVVTSRQGPAPKRAQVSPPPAAAAAAAAPTKPREKSDPGDDELDAVFQTDDQTLEELLGDVGPDEGFVAGHDDDERVKALLDELARSIPKDRDDKGGGGGGEDADADADSDDEGLKRDVDDVLARFRDELEVEGALTGEDDDEEEKPEDADTETKPPDPDKPLPSVEPSSSAPFSLPDLPPDLADLPPPSQPARASSTDLDALTARMAALRTSSPSTTSSPSAANLSLPDVPSGLPSKRKPPPPGSSFKRLATTTSYTDDDVDSWCVVCLEDATLRCLGCDDDVYCDRCWRDMHVGPAAGFDERTHRAVQFTRDGKKEEKRKIAIGA